LKGSKMTYSSAALHKNPNKPQAKKHRVTEDTTPGAQYTTEGVTNTQFLVGAKHENFSSRLHFQSNRSFQSAIVQRHDITLELISTTQARDLTNEQLRNQQATLEAHLSVTDAARHTFSTARKNLITLKTEFARRSLPNKTQAQHQRIAQSLVDFIRQQMDVYPEMVSRYTSQNTPRTNEKVRVLGAVRAGIARMEFFLGTIFHKGEAWETKNAGTIVDYFVGNEPRAWCTLFATKTLSVLTGIRGLSSGSGYNLARSSRIHFDEAQGGDFAGTRNSRDASSDSTHTASYNPWAELRQSLKRVDDHQDTTHTKPQLVQTFFTNHIHPQVGDLVVLRRSSATANSFSQDNPKTKGQSEAFQSHTAIIEKVNGTSIHIIEGNHDNRAGGRTLELTNPADVEEFIYIARPDLNTYQQQNAPATTAQAGSAVVTEAQLSEPVQHINAMLQVIASEGGWIESGDTNRPVAELVSDGGNSTD
jgi:hypothetical protein